MFLNIEDNYEGLSHLFDFDYKKSELEEYQYF